MGRGPDREERSHATRHEVRRKPRSASDDASLEQLQRLVGNAGMGQLLDETTTRTIESELGGGRPLAEALGGRDARDERSTGKTADPVRLHDDARSRELGGRLGAVAFTFGRDIFLGPDAPTLDSSSGRQMLAHELTHVSQQSGAAPSAPRRVSSPDSPAEREATRVAETSVSPGAAGPASAVHRQAEEEEELQALRAETVQRQERPEEEEELQALRAETVERQERPEEEEELQALRADTVGRQEMPAVEPAEGLAAPPPTGVSPALGGMFDFAIGEPVRAASQAMQASPPDAEAAFALLGNAILASQALASSYEASDPELALEILNYRHAINTIREILANLTGKTRSAGDVQGYLVEAVTRSSELRSRLH